jgi:hypothetical protein
MNQGVVFLVAIVIGVLAALGVANMVGQRGSAQTKTQSWVTIIAGLIVTLVAFLGLRSLFG